MVAVTLHGGLGRAMKREKWSLHVHSPSEALRAIQANSGGRLYPYLSSKANDSVQYAVLINGAEYVDEADLVIPRDRIKTIDIIPAVSGAGWGKILLGIGLIAVAVVATIFMPALSPVTLSLAKLGVGLLVSVGLSLALGGISELMTKTPKLGTNKNTARNFKNAEDSNKNDEDKKVSYLFSGVQNTTRQGNVVPIGYGVHRVGSQVISFGVSKTKVNYSEPLPIAPTAGDPLFLSTGWNTAEASAFAALVPSVSYVRHRTHAEIQALGITFVFTGPDSKRGKCTDAGLRNLLSVMSMLLAGPHAAPSLSQLKVTHDWSILSPLPTSPRPTWEQYAKALVGLYVPDIIW